MGNQILLLHFRRSRCIRLSTAGSPKYLGLSETSLQSEAESGSTQGDDQATTTTSVPTLNRSNTFTYSYSKKSEEGSSADQTKEIQSSTRPQKTLSKQCASYKTKQTSRLPTTSLPRH